MPGAYQPTEGLADVTMSREPQGEMFSTAVLNQLQLDQLFPLLIFLTLGADQSTVTKMFKEHMDVFNALVLHQLVQLSTIIFKVIMIHWLDWIFHHLVYTTPSMHWGTERERDPGSGSLNEGKGTGDSSASNSLRSIGLEIVGFDKGRQSVCDRTNNERFSASFGVSAKTLLAIFIDLKRKNPNMKEVDFLLAMNALKLYLTEKVMAGRWKCHEETYRHKWKTGVAAIAALRDYKIKFDPSDFPDDQIFLLSIDGVNCTMNEPRVYREQVANRELAVVPPPTLKLGPGSHWYDHKSHSAGVSYEVGVDVRKSRICWINGPKPGKKYISLCIL